MSLKIPLSSAGILVGGTGLSPWNSALVGVTVILLSLPLGSIRDHYGSFDRAVSWSPRKTARNLTR